MTKSGDEWYEEFQAEKARDQEITKNLLYSVAGTGAVATMLAGGMIANNMTKAVDNHMQREAVVVHATDDEAGDSKEYKLSRSLAESLRKKPDEGQEHNDPALRGYYYDDKGRHQVLKKERAAEFRQLLEKQHPELMESASRSR